MGDWIQVVKLVENLKMVQYHVQVPVDHHDVLHQMRIGAEINASSHARQYKLVDSIYHPAQACSIKWSLMLIRCPSVNSHKENIFIHCYGRFLHHFQTEIVKPKATLYINNMWKQPKSCKVWLLMVASKPTKSRHRNIVNLAKLMSLLYIDCANIIFSASK